MSDLTRTLAWLIAAAILTVASRTADAQALAPESAVVGGGVAERLDSVVSLCDRADFDALRFALYDASAAVRQLAVSCWSPERAGTEVLRPLLEDPDPTVRVSLAEILGADGGDDAQVLLGRMLSDPSATVRAAAVANLRPADPDAALTLLLPLVDDPALSVAASAAEAIERSGATVLLPVERQADFQFALAIAELREDLPEMMGVLGSIEGQLASLRTALGRAGAAEAACAESTEAALDDASRELRGLVVASLGPKRVDRFELVLAFEGRVAELARAYSTCVAASPLAFGASGPGGLLSGGRLLLTGEVDSEWFLHFGLLRADLEDPEGGELWTASTIGLDVFLPDRPESLTAPPDVPALDASFRARRDQLYRNNELSAWAWGGLVEGEIPFSCGADEICRAGISALGRRTTGEDSDFPDRLVAARHEADAELSLQVPIDSVVGRLAVGGALIRHLDADLEPADLDEARLGLTIDSPLQLRFSAVRSLYVNAGPTADRTSENSGLVRDHTLLDAMLGVRFGSPGPNGTLRLFVLGGVDFVLLDDLEAEIDPQIAFEAMLIAQDGDISGDLSRLTLGGRRYSEASPRDFVLQTVTTSSMEYVFQGVSPPDRGGRIAVRLHHSLVQHEGSLTALPDLDINVIAGGFDARLLLSRWMGFGFANETGAVRIGDGDFEVNNTFVLSMFVPVGRYDFGLAEVRPW